MDVIKDRIGEIGINTQGLTMRIKEYRGCNDIDIEFEDGYINKGKTYTSFKKGNIKNINYQNSKMINRTGEIKISNEGLKMWIREYRNANDIDIEFENNWIAKNKLYKEFKKGTVTNPYHKALLNVGYIGEGKYKSKINNIQTPQYIS